MKTKVLLLSLKTPGEHLVCVNILDWKAPLRVTQTPWKLLLALEGPTSPGLQDLHLAELGPCSLGSPV